MQTITFKIQESILKRIDDSLAGFNFSTRTEFIRDAIRDKLEEIDTEIFMRQLAKYKGAAKTNTSDEELEKIREQAWKEFAKKRGLKFR